MNEKKLRNNYTTVRSTKWITQVGKFTINSMVKTEFYLPVLSAKKIVTWKCHVDDYTTYRYNMIIGSVNTAMGLKSRMT